MHTAVAVLFTVSIMLFFIYVIRLERVMLHRRRLIRKVDELSKRAIQQGDYNYERFFTRYEDLPGFWAMVFCFWKPVAAKWHFKRLEEG